MESNILSVCIQKGGVGKTTMTLNLAVALNSLGKRVLMVDADPQANLTGSVLRGPTLNDGERPQTLSELIYNTVADIPCKPQTFIVNSALPCLDIIMSSKLLSVANSTLSMASDSGAILSRALAALTHDGADYDYILIDCAPSLDLLVTNCLNASDRVIIPTEPARFSVEGLIDLWETITRIQRTTNPKLQVAKIVVNKYDSRKTDHREYTAEIKEVFGDLVYPSPVPYLKEVEHSADDFQAMPKVKKSKAWPLFLELAEVIMNGHSES